MYKQRDVDPAPATRESSSWDRSGTSTPSMGDSLEWEGEYQPGDLISPTGWYLRDDLDTEAKSDTVTWFYRLNEDPDFKDAGRRRAGRRSIRSAADERHVHRKPDPADPVFSDLEFPEVERDRAVGGRAGHQGQLVQRGDVPAPVAHATARLDERSARLSEERG